jgi:membrane protein DedA with SNARE-associated domain
LLRLPIKEFSLWTFYGTVPRCLFLGYLGWGLGETYQSLAKGIDRAESIVSALLIIVIFGVIIWLRTKVRRQILEKNSP